MIIYHILSRLNSWMRQGKPNKCLIRALWKVGSSFVEASNEAELKQMVNTFYLKYRLETAFVLPQSVWQTAEWSLPHLHDMSKSINSTNTCLASIVSSFKCGCGFKAQQHKHYLLSNKYSLSVSSLLGSSCTCRWSDTHMQILPNNK